MARVEDELGGWVASQGERAVGHVALHPVGVHVADTEGVVARDNHMSGRLCDGVLLRSHSGGVPDCVSEPLPPTRNNVLLRNEVDGTFGAGLVVAGYEQAPEFGPLDNRIEQNVVRDSGGIGIYVIGAFDN